MKSTYSLLFDLTVTHTYFQNGFCKGLNYNVAKSTLDLMDRYNLKLLLTDRGFQFYSIRKTSIEDYLGYITRATGISYFEFDVAPIDAVFYQFTDLPINQLGELIFNSSDVQSERDFFVLQQQFQKERILADDLFKLRVNFEDLIAAEEIGIETHYKIEFVSRATRWQYNVINNGNQSIGELSIKGDENIEFDQGKEILLENGQTAMSFTSLSSDIVYSEVPKYKFDLINTIETLGRKRVETIFKSLPMPNPQQLQVEEDQTNNEVLSPAYVYI